jgi:hypothetical protein
MCSIIVYMRRFWLRVIFTVLCASSVDSLDYYVCSIAAPFPQLFLIQLSASFNFLLITILRSSCDCRSIVNGC